MAWTLRQYQICVYLSMYVGYMGFMTNRRSLSYVMPALMESEGFDKGQLGLISSSMMVAYTISKLIGGVLADQVNPKYLFSLGLFLSGLATLLYPHSGVLPLFCILQFVNGFAQGFSWPSCAKLLTKWFAKSQLATWWGILSTSSNLSGTFAPIVFSYLILHLGWKESVGILGTTTTILPLMFMFTIWNSPSEVGLEEFDGAKKDSKEDIPNSSSNVHWTDLIKSPFLIMITLGYMVAGLVRGACNDWGQLLLMQQHGHTQYMASAYNSSFEAGGLASSFVAGYIADKLVKNRKNDVGSPRIIVAIAGLLVTAIFLFLFAVFTTPESSYIFITSVSFMMGGGVYTLVCLFGVMSTEAAPARLSGTSHAIGAFGANTGYVLGGFPIAVLAKYIEWSGVFLFLAILTFVTTALTTVFKDLKLGVQEDLGKKRN